MKDFIITSLQPWDIEIGSTIKNTALEIARQNRVLFVNPPQTLMQWLHTLFQKKEKKETEKWVTPRLLVVRCRYPALPVASMPWKWLFRAMNYCNNLLIAATLERAMKKHRFHDVIHLMDTDIFRSRYLKQLLHPALSIYYRRDYVIGVDYWKKYGPECERQLARQSDIVITNSSNFTEELKPLNPHTYTTNTGVNLQLYDAGQPHDPPADMEGIPLPVIGYTGVLTGQRLDADLLLEIAQRMPQCSFVFVGPEDDYFARHALRRLPNTYFTGRKPVSELPAYIRHFTVCINPQKLNPITDGNYPLKVDEYLAMGKPVVATSTHTMRDVFAAHTHLASSADEWTAALERAIREAGNHELEEQRIAFARTHSWAHSVEKIYEIIEQYENTNPL